MGDLNNIVHVLIFLLNIGTLLTSIANPPSTAPKHPTQVPEPRLSPSQTVQTPCAPPSTPPKPPSTAPKQPPPQVPKPPPPPPPTVQTPCPPPPSPPKPPVVKTPPYIPKTPLPVFRPPMTPKPPNHPKPPPPSPTGGTPCPPPKKQDTCPIDTLKLGLCVDVLGILIEIGIGPSATATCCPVLDGLVDYDAALCLCTTIQDKLLDVNVFMPVGLQVLAGCGKNPPSGFQCPA